MLPVLTYQKRLIIWNKGSSTYMRIFSGSQLHPYFVHTSHRVIANIFHAMGTCATEIIRPDYVFCLVMYLLLQTPTRTLSSTLIICWPLQ